MVFSLPLNSKIWLQACLSVCLKHHHWWSMNTKHECVQVLYSHQCFFAAKSLCHKKLGHTAMKETFFCPEPIPAEWFWKVSSAWIYCTSNGLANLGLQTALIQVTSSPAHSHTHGEEKGSLMWEAKFAPLWSTMKKLVGKGAGEDK